MHPSNHAIPLAEERRGWKEKEGAAMKMVVGSEVIMLEYKKCLQDYALELAASFVLIFVGENYGFDCFVKHLFKTCAR